MIIQMACPSRLNRTCAGRGLKCCEVQHEYNCACQCALCYDMETGACQVWSGEESSEIEENKSKEEE